MWLEYRTGEYEDLNLGEKQEEGKARAHSCKHCQLSPSVNSNAKRLIHHRDVHLQPLEVKFIKFGASSTRSKATENGKEEEGQKFARSEASRG